MRREQKTWTLSLEHLAGELCAVIRESEKMDTAIVVRDDQKPWFITLQWLLKQEGHHG